MLNRRTFLGAAVAAMILPAGEVLAAKPVSGHVLSDRKIEAHETPEGVLYTVQDGKRRTVVAARSGPNDNYGECPSEPLPPAFIVMSIPVVDGEARYDIATRMILPAPTDGRIVNLFSRPPSLEDVVAFHEACCADVPGRVIDAVDGPSGALHEVRDGQRTTKTLKRHSLNPANRPVFSLWSVATLASQVDDLPPRGVVSTFDRPSLSEVLAFHEQCAEDGAAAPRG